MSGPDLAESLELTEPAVRSRLRRALERLRIAIAQVAASPEESESVTTHLDKWAASLRDER